LGDFEKIYETINENRPLIEMKISEKHQNYYTERENVLKPTDLVEKAKIIKEINESGNDLSSVLAK
jgi:hypothetical protein